MIKGQTGESVQVHATLIKAAVTELQINKVLFTVGNLRKHLDLLGKLITA